MLVFSTKSKTEWKTFKMNKVKIVTRIIAWSKLIFGKFAAMLHYYSLFYRSQILKQKILIISHSTTILVLKTHFLQKINSTFSYKVTKKLRFFFNILTGKRDHKNPNGSRFQKLWCLTEKIVKNKKYCTVRKNGKYIDVKI